MSSSDSDKVQKSEQQKEQDRKFPKTEAWALNWDRKGLSETERDEPTPPKPKSSR